MTVSAYFTDSHLSPEGRGGDVVSFHEFNALQSVTNVRSIYQNVGKLHVQEAYDRNPFMYDYYLASIIDKPEEIELAQFYGSGYTVTMKVLHKAVKIATCPAHNLELSLEEWNNYSELFGKPPQHLTDPFLFDLGAQGLKSCNAVVCPSRASQTYLQQKLGLTNITLIPHGVDLPEKWSSHRDEFLVFHLGQCLSNETFVIKTDGNISRIGDLKIGDCICAYDAEKGQIPATVTMVYENGLQPVYKIRTSNREIEATSNHKFLAVRNKRSKHKHYFEWVQVADLTLDDHIIVPLRIPISSPQNIVLKGLGNVSPDLMRIIGCFLGDGYMRIRLRGNHKDYEWRLHLPEGDRFRSKYINLCSKVFHYEPRTYKDCIVLWSRDIVEGFISAGLEGNYRSKTIPSWVFTLPDEHIRALLEGLFDSDGTYVEYGKGKYCALKLANRNLVEQTKTLALRIGLKADNVAYFRTKDTRFIPSRFHDAWRVRFYLSGNTRELKGIRPSGRNRTNLPDNIGIDKIKGIQYIGRKNVYNITLNPSPAYFANGMVTHNCGPDKGQKYLMQAWKTLQPLRNAEFIFASQNLTQIAYQGIPNFKMYGTITSQTKEQLYAKTAVYVQPSVSEGWGIPVAEAMAHGCAVIVAEGAGAADMVTDGEDGFIVPIRNPLAIAEKIKYFYCNPSEIERMGNNARKKAEQYSWKIIEQKYVELIKSLMP